MDWPQRRRLSRQRRMARPSGRRGDNVAADTTDSPLHIIPGTIAMRTAAPFRASLIALSALAGLAFQSAARAEDGSISFNVIKAGIVIGGSGGSGTLVFR